MNKESAESAALWDALFYAILKLTEAGEVDWRPEVGGLRTGIQLFCDEKSNDHDEEVGVISVLAEKEYNPFTTEAATTLHKSLRDKYRYSEDGTTGEEESLDKVIARTEEPTVLPSWYSRTADCEDVG